MSVAGVVSRGLSVIRRALSLALTLLLAGSSSCASLMEETVHNERGPLLRTFDRPRIVEGGIKGEVSVQWPKLTLTLRGFDTCRTEKVEEYAEEKIHERHGAGAGASLSVGVVTAGAGALLLAFSGLFSANPDTNSIDENGNYGPPARDIARGWAVGLLCVGVPALAVAAIQLLRNGDEVEAIKVEQIAGQHDETCHERAITGPIFLSAENGSRSAPLPTSTEGILELDAATVTAPIEDFVFYERVVPLDEASERLLDGFNGCVVLEHDSMASVEGLTTAALLKRLEAARACRQLRNDEASLAQENALKTEVTRRRQGGEHVGYVAESFDDALTTHPPKLVLGADSSAADVAKLDDSALQGATVLLTGAVNGGLSPNIGVVRVANRDVYVFLPPDAPWASDDFPSKTPVEVIGTLSGVQTVGDLTAPLVKALWMRKLSPPHQ